VSLGLIIVGALIRAYRLSVSPVLHLVTGPAAGCRFQPTCSEYALAAVNTHGAVRGGLLAARRVCRCHPWSGCGHDPVPEVWSSAFGRPAGISSGSRVNAGLQTPDRLKAGLQTSVSPP
jgi:putative membrane protein insertion efficiency factor